MKTVEFQFDFGSPNAYLSHAVIPGIEARTGATFEYVPVLLGGLFKATGNQPPFMAYAGVPAKMAYEQLELRRFVDRHQIPFRMNPHFPVNTLLMMRMATAAAMEGKARDFASAVFPLMWEKGVNMGDPEIVAAGLAEAGLDAAHWAARAQAPEVKARLADVTESAVRRGAFGSPSFFLGDDLYFGKNTLAEIETHLAS
ncbi:2-hydroxychromene-2-carboxylate isomerase [Hyphomonas sp.]|uniref:2-hydroxychromene-2-carboxylate isomerase n=1 Tax=Hyphomonas sp. TaxID=87 RepID=UPI00391A16EA